MAEALAERREAYGLTGRPVRPVACRPTRVPSAQRSRGYLNWPAANRSSSSSSDRSFVSGR
jgi:hypothetical protein